MEHESVVMQQQQQQSVRTASSDADSGCALDEYTWVPPGLTTQQVAEYMHALPVQCVPYSGGSVGDRWRAAQLLRQLPPQDTEVRYCHGLSDEEKRELRLFSAQRRHDSLGRATVLPVTVTAKCHQCGGAITVDELAVYATRAKPGTVWHPACFMCCVCMELLVDLIYFCGKDGQLYCGRHHAETLKPRCSACDEIIFSDECTEAEGFSWHTKHFVCCGCEFPLGGQRYVMTDGRPLCCVCYDRAYAAECAMCRQTIHVTEGHMVHGSRRWHASESCFRCDLCACSLLGCPFVAVPGKDAIYCADCGVMHKATSSTSYDDKPNGITAGNCLSPSSPMMKVREPVGKTFSNKFEDVHDKQSRHGGTPVKSAAKLISPCDSPLQSKAAAVELQVHSACANSVSCCDDHRLSGEFQACASSLADHNIALASQLSSQNDKSSPCISPIKYSVNDIGSAALTTECGNVNDAAASVSSPRPPVLVASEADCLDNANEINSMLEELVVEPLWSHGELDNGLTADGGAEVADMLDDGRQKSRKSKNLNVRFDPSTKDACSPATHGVMHRDHWRHSSSYQHRSLDDSDIPYIPCGSRQCHATGPNGSASVRISRRQFGHGSHRGQSNMWLDVDVPGNGNHRGSGWWVDDYEHCSTCSSSSSDSDFDYGNAAFNSKATAVRSQTLPQQRRNVGLAASVASDQVPRARKHKKKHCIVS